MYLILWIAGLWALIAGRITISQNLKLKDSPARAFGGMVLAYALFVHPSLVLLRLRFLPMGGQAVRGPVIFLLSEAIIIIVALLLLFKLTLYVFPEARDENIVSGRGWFSPAFWVVCVAIIAAVIGIRSFARNSSKMISPIERVRSLNLTPYLEYATPRLERSPVIEGDVGKPRDVRDVRDVRGRCCHSAFSVARPSLL